MADLPFLPEQPPHWAARGLSALVFVLAAAVVVGAAVIRVPETVDSAFVLAPQHGADPVRASHDGLIEQVRVAEGQSVKKGEILYLLRASPVGDRSSERTSLEAQVRGAEKSLDNAQAQNRSSEMAERQQDARYRARLEELARIVELKAKQQQMAAELSDKYGRLEGKGYVSHEAVLKQQAEASRLAVDVEQARAEQAETQSLLERAHLDAERRELAFRESVRQLREERDRAGVRAGALGRDPLIQADGAVGLTAACDSVVIRQKVRAAGAVVLDGDVLCELACAADPLQAELAVPPAGVGRLRVGQGVKLLYDAFPYQRFGVRYATLRWISPAGAGGETHGGAGDAFRVVADIADRSMALPDGPRPLLAGMGGRARVVVGSRTLASFLLAPLRGVAEDLASPPAVAPERR